MADRSLISEFTQITAPHHKHLYGIALSLCRDSDQAADLTQEALVRAFKAFDRFQRDAPVLPWLRRILRNVFLDSLKTGRARHEVAEHRDAAAAEAVRLEPAHEEDPLAQLERSQLSQWVRVEISGMDEEHQQVLELCVMQELSFTEAADLMGTPVGTVASRLSRARAQLRSRVLKRISRRNSQEVAVQRDSSRLLGRIQSEGSRLPGSAKGKDK